LTVLTDRPEVKGECTLLVDGAAAADPVSDADLADALRDALAQPGARLSGLSKAFAQQYHLPRKTVYEMALTIQKETDTLA
jgi:16S rRNA (cytidine1402-2'-O)-methyltransferase